MTNTLKPCPFCGGEARQSYVGAKHMVFCTSCMIQTEPFSLADEAIAAWNRRPPARALTLDELRGMEGKPVWVVEHPDWGHWELSVDAEDYIADRDTDFYGMMHDDPAGRYGLHALGWVAYDREPDAD